MKNIELINVTQNNLKNINLNIPKQKITVFTGVSGSGKSSIVFDTIAQEAKREVNETFDAYARRFLPKTERPNVEQINNISLSIVIDQKQLGGNSRSTVGTITDINPLLRLLFSRFSKNSAGASNCYSFNDPAGMCEDCQGIGVISKLDLNKAIDFDKSLNEGAILLQGHKPGTWYFKMYADSGYFDNDKKIKDYSKEELDKLLYFEGVKIKVNNVNINYEGIVTKFNRQNISGEYQKSDSSLEKAQEYMSEEVCESCKGKRFNERVLKSTINDKNISDLLDMQINELNEFICKIDMNGSESLVNTLSRKLTDLVNIGLEYLSLSRHTNSLSGGESQRIKMVKHLSNSLTDVIYIFDEPSTGLHVRDVNKLNELLISLRDKGNTILIVEHDPDVIKIADHVVDVGPKAGKHGGEITYEGTYENLKNSDCLTAKFLTKQYDLNMNPRVAKEFITSSKSSLNNLKDQRLKIAKNCFNVITGVAGSGKSTLVNQVFLKEHPEAVFIDQKGVHTTKRSNPLTFMGIMDDIRKLYAKEFNMKPGEFSYNTKGGCEKCGGSGVITLNLAFMDDAEIVCDSCNGHRYKTEILKYKLNDKNIVEILEMSVEESLDFFKSPKIVKSLTALNDVGLGYLILGQSLNTLSGGECQRLKLARELLLQSDIYILDEPTTGLHLSDIELIVSIINKLVENNSTVIVIEHNVEVIKCADYIVDLGPEGGKNGGEIIYEGPINKIVENSKSITAKYLK